MLAPKFARLTPTCRQVVAQQIFRSYASQTNDSSTGLNPELRALLKPEVLKKVESKTDTVLFKKLNFLGKNIVIRLNIAPQLFLDNLSSDNVFRLLKQLKDPWTYYWTEVKQNGNDSQKWLESLKEVQDMPLVAERCFREMIMSNVYPSVEHFNQLFAINAKCGDAQIMSFNFDDVRRNNLEGSLDAESFNQQGLLWARKGNYYFAEQIIKQMKKKGMAVKPELEQQVAQLSKNNDEQESLEYWTGRTPTKSASLTTQDDLTKQARDNIGKSADKSRQPSLDKLVMKQ